MANKKKNRKDGVKDIVKGVKGIIDTTKESAKSMAENKFNPLYAGKGVLDQVTGYAKGLGNVGKGLFKAITGQHSEWYTKELPEGLVSVNTNLRSNLPLDEYDVVTQWSTGGSLKRANAGVPTMMVLNTRLVKPATAVDADDPWNKAIAIMYSRIRSANSGSINYSMNQLSGYVFNVRTLHALSAELERCFTLLNSIKRNDAASPKLYLKALGYNYDDLSEHSADLLAIGNRINKTISELFPLNISLIDRTRWMFSNVFTDTNKSKPNCYAFLLKQAHYIPDLNGEDIHPVFSSDHIQTVSAMGYTGITIAVNRVLNALSADNTAMIIAGDIIKTYGATSIYPYRPWDLNMEARFVYDINALTQIQNATLGIGTYKIMNQTTSDATGGKAFAMTYSANNGVSIDNTLTATDPDVINEYLYVHPHSALLNFNKVADPAIGDILSATRLTNVLVPTTTSNQYKVVLGTEVVDTALVFFKLSNNIALAEAPYNGSPVEWFDWLPGTQDDPIYFIPYAYLTAIATFGNIDTGSNEFNDIQNYGMGVLACHSLLSVFDYHPLIRMKYQYYVDGSSGDRIYTYALPYGDLSMFSSVSGINISNYNAYAVTSLLSVPRQIKVNKTERV